MQPHLSISIQKRLPEPLPGCANFQRILDLLLIEHRPTSPVQRMEVGRMAMALFRKAALATEIDARVLAAVASRFPDADPRDPDCYAVVASSLSTTDAAYRRLIRDLRVAGQSYTRTLSCLTMNRSMKRRLNPDSSIEVSLIQSNAGYGVAK